MFLGSDNVDSRAVESEIIRRLAGRVIEAFSDDIHTTDRVQQASCDCESQRMKNGTDHGIVTIAAIEVVLEEALYPILQRLDSMERKLFKADCADRQGQDVPITVTPSSTPVFGYDGDGYDHPQASPNSMGSFMFAASLFDASDSATSDDIYSSASVSDSDSGTSKDKGDCKADGYYRALFTAPDPPDDTSGSNREDTSPDPYADSVSSHSPLTFVSRPVRSGHRPKGRRSRRKKGRCHRDSATTKKPGE